MRINDIEIIEIKTESLIKGVFKNINELIDTNGRLYLYINTDIHPLNIPFSIKENKPVISYIIDRIYQLIDENRINKENIAEITDSILGFKIISIDNGNNRTERQFEIERTKKYKAYSFTDILIGYVKSNADAVQTIRWFIERDLHQRKKVDISSYKNTDNLFIKAFALYNCEDNPENFKEFIFVKELLNLACINTYKLFTVKKPKNKKVINLEHF